MTTAANGRCDSAPAEVVIAIGTNPKDATSPVVNTGRSKSWSPLLIIWFCSHGIGILFTKFVEVIYHRDTIQYCYPEQSNESYSYWDMLNGSPRRPKCGDTTDER